MAYGFDWINYYSSFQNISHGYSDSFFFEPMMKWIMMLVSYFGLSFTYFYFFASIIIYSCLYYFCCRLKLPSLGFFTIFSFMGFYLFSEGVRQGVAMAIILCALVNLIRGEKRIFYILVAIASLAHISAIFSLAYPLYTKVTKKSFKKVTIALVSIFTLLLVLLNFPSVVAVIPFVGQKFAAYSTYFIPQEGFVDYLLKGRILLIYLFMYVFVFYLLRFKVNDGYEMNSLYSSLSSCFILCATRISPVLIRFGFFPIPVIVLNMDDYFSGKGVLGKTKLYKALYLLILLLMSSSYVYFNELYKKSSETNLSIFSSQSDINREIARKCDILNKNDSNSVIGKCFSPNYDI